MLRPASRSWLPIVVAVVFSSLLHLALWHVGQLVSPPPEPQQTPPQIIEVALIQAAPAAPPVAPPKVEPRKPPPEKKAVPPPPVKEKKPIPRKEVRPEPPPLAESKQEVQPAPTLADSAPVATEVKQAAPSPAPYVEASYRTPGLNNPPKRYPPIAQQRGWEGQVVLKVKVLANGSPGEITIAKSSGHELLDEATIEQVRSWRFTPARRGNVAVEGSIFVPIDYKLTR